MPRTLALAGRPWPRRSADELAQKAAEWGYQALELPFTAPEAAVPLQELLERHELRLAALSVHAIGPLLGDRLDASHARLAPALWGDGAEAGVRQRAAEALANAALSAKALGAEIVVGRCGLPLASSWREPQAAARGDLAAAWRQFSATWTPLLQRCAEAGVRFALEVQPGEMAFDFHSAEAALKALDHHEAFGFALNPGALHWQGVDPAEFVRAFPDRILHVYLKDSAVALNGRNGILCSHLPSGDPRRGWDWRHPGLGGVDWPNLVRALHEANYGGPFAVDLLDPAVDLEWAAADAVGFARRIDFPPREGLDPAFTDDE